MPKKKRDEKGQAVPDRPDKFQWTCKQCHPSVTIKGATKRDVINAQNLHKLFVH